MATRYLFVAIINLKFFITMKMNNLTGICILDCISKMKTIDIPRSCFIDAH